MGVNVRWQLLAAIAFEKQVTWCGFPRIKGRCPGYNVYNTQGFNLADWQLLETAFTKRTLTLQKWTQGMFLLSSRLYVLLLMSCCSSVQLQSRNC